MNVNGGRLPLRLKLRPNIKKILGAFVAPSLRFPPMLDSHGIFATTKRGLGFRSYARTEADRSGSKLSKLRSRFTLFPSKFLLTVILCLRRRETRLACATVTGGYPEIKKARARETREEETERTAFAEMPSRATERS